MVISKFNQLIHNKKFLVVITGLICVTFIGLYLPGQKGKRATRKAQTVGRLYGKSVLSQEFSAARNASYLTFTLSMGRRLDLDDRTNELLDRAAWTRLALLKKADQMNISSSDAEMVQMVRSQPFFMNQQGQFDGQGYKYFIANILPQFGYTARQFEEVYRDESTLRKIAFLPVQAALVTPAELKEVFHRVSDTFTLQYASFDESVVKASVTVSDEEVAAFYDDNSGLFETPARVRVQYAAFPVANYAANVVVNDADAQSFYDRNLMQYISKPATNDVPAEYKLFEDVKPEIISNLKLIGARRKAAELATTMVIGLTPARAGSKVATFEEAAAEMGVAIKNCPDFAENELAEGVDAGREFVRSAFALDDSLTGRYSDAVVGVDYVYVIHLVKRLDAFVPGFELVKERAKELALNRAVRTALYEKAKALGDAASVEGASFEAVFTAIGAKIKTTPAFTLTAGLADEENGRMLTSVASVLKQGEVSAPVSAQDGSVIVARLAARVAADEAEMDTLRESLVAAVENQRVQAIMETWNDSILAEADFENLVPVR
jgi:peptidyl-prolyl cis-trans isomerase D